MKFERIWTIVLLLISLISMGSNFILGLLALLTTIVWLVFLKQYGKQLLVVWAVLIFLAFLV